MVGLSGRDGVGPPVAALGREDHQRSPLEPFLHPLLLLFFGFLLEIHDCFRVETETDHNRPEEMHVVNMGRYPLARKVLVHDNLIELALNS